MAVVIETTLGDVTVDLFADQRPLTCLNFLKLCKLKYYNFNLFHTIQHGFIAQTGDPSGEGTGGQSVWGITDGPNKRYFEGERMPKIKHTDPGFLSMVATNDGMIGSQFFFTLGADLNSLDSQHCVIGKVTEGHDVLRQMNETICDANNRPYQDVRITHTVVLEDPFSDPKDFREPSRSPSPSAERLAGGRIAPDEELDETLGKTEEEINEMIQDREAKAKATILEIVGDLPDADMAPPENVLFVCKLNPVTSDDDLEIIFSRFGKIMCCEVIRDRKTGDSLQYAFIEFENKKSCEDAYFKMDNVLIDDRRIHVDFSQSVSKIKWQGKGRGVIITDNNGSTKNIGNTKPLNRLRNNDNHTRDYREARINKNERDDSHERYSRDNSYSKERQQEVKKYKEDFSQSRNKHDKYSDRGRSRERDVSPVTQQSIRHKMKEKNYERDGIEKSRYKSPDRTKNRDRSPRVRDRTPDKSRMREKTQEKSKMHDISPERYRVQARTPEKSRIRGRTPDKYKIRNKIPEKFRIRDRTPERSRIRDRTPEKSRKRSKTPERYRIRDRTPDHTNRTKNHSKTSEKTNERKRSPNRSDRESKSKYYKEQDRRDKYKK